MSNLPLRSIFSSILLGHLGAAAALSGCTVTAGPDAPEAVSGSGGRSGAGGAGGAGGSYPVISSAGFDAMSCSPLLAGAAAKIGVDSIELWQATDLLEGMTSKKVEADGVECGGASDRAACLLALEALRAQRAWDEYLVVRTMSLPGPRGQPVYRAPPERFLLTDGGEVKVVDSEAELSALLGPIDSVEKLRFMSHYSPRIGCEHVRRTERGYEIIGSQLVSDCPFTYQRVLTEITTGGEVNELVRGELTETGGCAGRRPAGLGAQAVASAGALARHLERQAYLEGASVEAFERFARELEAFGAPPELARRALDARKDEVRHHAMLVALGRRFDPAFSCAEPLAAPATRRSLYAFALENAVEGCVRETWGALLAHHQAARAADGAVRFACGLIADDETKHAELSWAAHAWLLERLSEGERAAIAAAMGEAAAELLGELAAGGELSEGERAALGLPSADGACALAAGLRERLWARPRAA